MPVWSEWIINVKLMVYVPSCNSCFIEQYVSFYYSQLISAHVFHYAAHVNSYAIRRSWMYNCSQIIFMSYSYGFKATTVTGNHLSRGILFPSPVTNLTGKTRFYVLSRWNDNIKFQHSTTRQIGSFCCLFRA